MQIDLVLNLPDNLSETILTISAVAPVRTGLQLMMSAFITLTSNYQIFYLVNWIRWIDYTKIINNFTLKVKQKNQLTNNITWDIIRSSL